SSSRQAPPASCDTTARTVIGFWHEVGLSPSTSLMRSMSCALSGHPSLGACHSSESAATAGCSGDAALAEAATSSVKKEAPKGTCTLSHGANAVPPIAQMRGAWCLSDVHGAATLKATDPVACAGRQRSHVCLDGDPHAHSLLGSPRSPRRHLSTVRHRG